MALILSVDTATKACSVAIAVDGETIDSKILNGAQFSHAENLHLMIDDLLKSNLMKPTDLDSIAVSEGPGSYTGLRIGVSAVKGLCFALRKPMIALSTLRILAENPVVISTDADLFCPMIDARRNEVYTALFNRQGEDVRPVEPLILDDHWFEDYLKQHRIVFFGDGAAKFESQIEHQHASFVADVCPRAADMSGLAEEKYRQGKFENIAYFEPFYLKEFVAGKPKKQN